MNYNTLPLIVRDKLIKLNINEQLSFEQEYSRRLKSSFNAYLFWFLLGWHYAYIRKWGLQVIFCLTMGGFLIWWLIDLFRVSAMVRNYNNDLSIEILKDITLIYGNSSNSIIATNNKENDSTPFTERKKNNPNETFNDIHNNVNENQTTVSDVNLFTTNQSEEEKNEKGYLNYFLIFLVVILAIFTFSKHKYVGEKIQQSYKYFSNKINFNQDPDGFNETSFENRQAEVQYIREYANYKFGLIRDKYFTDYYNNLDSYHSKEEIEQSKNAARPFTDLIVMLYLTEPLMKEVVRQNLSISKVKDILNNPEVQKKFESVMKNNQRKKINQSKKLNYPIKESVYSTENIEDESVESVAPDYKENKDSILNEVILMNTTSKQ